MEARALQASQTASPHSFTHIYAYMYDYEKEVASAKKGLVFVHC